MPAGRAASSSVSSVRSCSGVRSPPWGGDRHMAGCGLLDVAVDLLAGEHLAQRPEGRPLAAVQEALGAGAQLRVGLVRARGRSGVGDGADAGDGHRQDGQGVGRDRLVAGLDIARGDSDRALVLGHGDGFGGLVLELGLVVEQAGTRRDADGPAGAAGAAEADLDRRPCPLDPLHVEQRDHFVQRAAGGGVDEARLVDRLQLGVEAGDLQRDRLGHRAQHAADLQIGQARGVVLAQVIDVDEGARVRELGRGDPGQGLLVGLQLVVAAGAKRERLAVAGAVDRHHLARRRLLQVVARREAVHRREGVRLGRHAADQGGQQVVEHFRIVTSSEAHDRDSCGCDAVQPRSRVNGPRSMTALSPIARTWISMSMRWRPPGWSATATETISAIRRSCFRASIT